MVKTSRPSKAERMKAIYENLWPNAEGRTWHRKKNKGFTTIPRLLPLVIRFFSYQSTTLNLSGVYLDLWARSFDEGIVSIEDDMACAYASGYDGTRAQRSWRERVWELQKLGFIEIKPQGLRDIGYIMLLDPIKVCVEKRKRDAKHVPDEWWNAFVARADEIGAVLDGFAESESPPPPPPPPPPAHVRKKGNRSKAPPSAVEGIVEF